MTMDAPKGELPQDANTPADEPSRDDFPETVGSFQIEDLLAAAGDGLSYLASDTRYDNRFVTLKVLPAELGEAEEAIDAVESAVAEARRLSHRHLIAPLRLEQHPEKNNLSFIVFPHMPGRQLDALLEEHSAGLPPQRVVRWADQLADALDYAHERRVLHRNICSSNVIIDDNNDAYLIGFGTSRATLDALHVDDEPSAFRSPSAADGSSTRADDVYALAATIYAALDGGPPQAWSITKNGRQVYEPRPIDGQSAQINMALLAGLASDPASRPASARDFVQALQGAPIKVNIPRPAPTVQRKSVLVPIALLILLAAATGFVAWQLSKPGPVQPMPLPGVTSPGVTSSDTIASDQHGELVVADVAARPEQSIQDAAVEPAPTIDAVKPIASPPSVAASTEDTEAETLELGAASEEIGRVAELLVPIESRLSEARYQVLTLRHQNNPAVHRHLWLAQDHIDLAKENKQRANHAAAERAYERAIEEFSLAAKQDEQVSALAIRAEQLAAQATTVEWPEIATSADDRHRLHEMLLAAQQALDEGELAAAAAGFDDVQQTIEALPAIAAAAQQAVAARSAWGQVASEVPQPLYDQLAHDKRQLDILLEEAQQQFDAGNFAEAESLWKQADSIAARLIQKHGEALASATACRNDCEQALAAAPTQWFKDDRITAKATSAVQQAAQGEAALSEARFDDACTSFALARDLFAQADSMHAAAVENALSATDTLMNEGKFDEALAQLDSTRPYILESDWRERRMNLLLLQSRALNDPATKEAARQAVGRLLAMDPTHTEGLRLHEQVSDYFGPEAGDTESNALGMPLVFVPAGTYSMGSPESEPLRDPSELEHTVRISNGFWMGQTEVTRGQFRQFVDATGYVTDAEKAGSAFGLGPKGQWKKVDGLSWRNPGFDQTESHPVVCISQRDARAFCEWLTKEDKRLHRLPTEAEWEYACRAGSTDAYPWGSSPSDIETRANVGDQRWSRLSPDSDAFGFDDGYTYTSPVAEFLPNAWGLFDMIGNAQEWCSDLYGSYSSVRAIDPTGPESGSSRIVRGGSFLAGPGFARSAQRDASMDVVRFAHHGFRVVVAPPEPPEPPESPESPKTPPPHRGAEGNQS